MPIKWKKVWISDECYESAGVFDANGDGKPDIVSGGFWYEGPDFKKKRPVAEIKKYGEYYDDFSTIALDVNGNGRLDVIIAAEAVAGRFACHVRCRQTPQLVIYHRQQLRRIALFAAGQSVQKNRYFAHAPNSAKSLLRWRLAINVS